MRRLSLTCSRESGCPEQDEKQPQQPQQQQEQHRAASWTGCLLSQSFVRSVARPPPPTDDVQRFVEEYVRTHTSLLASAGSRTTSSNCRPLPLASIRNA